MKQLKFSTLLAVTVLILSFTAFSQESQTKVVDEVVAQVNDDVITLSQVKRETKDLIESYVQDGKKRDEAEKMVEDKQGELIANLINEELLVQRAKDLGLDSDVEASLNQRFLQIMKQYNLKTLDALYAEMEKQGVDPQSIKEIWRKQATRDAVIQREVQAKLYWQASGTEVKEYYEKNKAKFTKPETVTLSEIFLSFAGNDQAAVRAKAKSLVAQLRAGADFEKAALENSDRQNVAETKGKVDTFDVKDLDPRIAAAVNGLKAGAIADPVEIDQVGITILKVDGRTQASSDSQFDENAVRMAILSENAAEEQKKFMTKLREDSYIKISENYRPLVSPLLFADERSEKPKSK